MILLALEDVTGRRKDERARAELLTLAEEARDRARRADAAKDVFLADFSHELQSPLAAILLHADALKAGRLDGPGVVRAGASIEAITRRQLRRVEDLVDVPRIAAGKLHLGMEGVDLRALVREVVERTRTAAEERSVRLVADGDGEPLLCLGDPGRLQQVVGTLIANAVRFTPGGGRVDVRVDATDGVVRLVVADTGRGIAPAFLPHVFERFAQEDGASSHAPGFGLGLAIVQDLVGMHGGTVRAESPGRDRGSTFTVTLPRHVPLGAAAG
jgi:signal transduction histidine kinase